MQEASVGLLYGSETLFIITVFSGLLGLLYRVNLPYFLSWVEITFAIFVFSVVLYRIYKIRYRRFYKSIMDLFEDCQKLDRETVPSRDK
jgi:hypothetical protein